MESFHIEFHVEIFQRLRTIYLSILFEEDLLCYREIIYDSVLCHKRYCFRRFQ